MKHVRWYCLSRFALIGTAIGIAFSGNPAIAQSVAMSPPTAAIVAQSIDLDRYYPSRSAARGELEALTRDADSVREPIAAADVGTYLERADALLGRSRSLSVYFTILGARNLDDRAAKADAEKADAVREAIMAKVGVALRSLPAGDTAALANHDPRLERYAYLAAETAGEAAHRLSKDETRVLDATAGSALGTYWTIYQKTARLPLTAPTMSAATIGPSDRSTREADWRARWQSASTKADVNAAILLAIVGQNEKVAKLRHYPDAASAGYADRGLDRTMVDRSLAAVRANQPLYQSYHRFQAARLRRIAAIADPRPWDLALLRDGPTQHLTFGDVRRVVPTALAPFGADYVRHFTALLAPNAGRVDAVAATGNRESGGFSVNAPGVPAGLYMASFNGSQDDMRVVLHEGGHAIAAQFANEGGTSSFFVDGPNWLMESYAILNEFLLYDHLARTSTTAAERAYYANLLLEDMMFQVFGSAEEATLEQTIYDGVAAGTIRSTADLNDAGFRVMRGFEPWPDDILRTSSTLWSTKRLMFQDPFYLVNYMYAGIVAINLYREAKAHPESFPGRYRALLRRGYDAPPMTLLAPILGKDITGDALATSAFHAMQDELIKVSKRDGR